MEAAQGLTEAEHAAALREGKRLCAEEGTVSVFKAALGVIARDRTYTLSMLRVLFALVVMCEPGNYIYFSAAEMARRLTMNYHTCWRAWKAVMGKDWLREEVNDRGRTVRYRVSPHLCWQGRPWKASVAQRNWDAEGELARLAAQWKA